MEGCDSANFVKISVDWIVSNSGRCLRDVDLTFSGLCGVFFLYSSATDTVIEGGLIFLSFCGFVSHESMNTTPVSFDVSVWHSFLLVGWCSNGTEG